MQPPMEDFGPTYGLPTYGNVGNTKNGGPSTNIIGRMQPTANRVSTRVPGTRSVTSMTMVQKPEPKKTTTKKEIVVNPEFMAIVDEIKDPEWKRILSFAAIGKFHKGMTYENFTLVFKKNQRVLFSKKLEGSDREKCLQYIELIKSKLSERSEKDNEESRDKQQQSDVNLNNMYSSWSDVRKKDEKLSLIEIFIEGQNKRMNLSSTEYQDLRETIFRAFCADLFNNDTISLLNGKINNISCITFDFQTREFRISDFNHSSSKAEEIFLPEEEYLNPYNSINSKPTPVSLDKKLSDMIKAIGRE
jgi:hypothetical protein